jgi:hypothetical protein
VDRLIGKIKWFSSGDSSGVLASIGGTSLDFTCTDASAPFSPGQVVTYRSIEAGTADAFASDVRAQ